MKYKSLEEKIYPKPFSKNKKEKEEKFLNSFVGFVFGGIWVLMIAALIDIWTDIFMLVILGSWFIGFIGLLRMMKKDSEY